MKHDQGKFSYFTISLQKPEIERVIRFDQTRVDCCAICGNLDMMDSTAACGTASNGIRLLISRLFVEVSGQSH